MNTTTRNVIIAAAAVLLIIGIVIAVLLLTGSSEADRINSELAQMSDSVSDSAEEKKDGEVTTGEYAHTSEPVIAEEEPDESNTNNDSEPSAPAEPTKPQTTAAATTRPAVTVVTTTPAVTAPPSTVRTDLPVVTAEPTTAATTPAEPEIEIEYDDDGFPADPEPSERYQDESGQWWIYNPIFGWLEHSGGDGKTTMYEFPDFEVEGGDEQILW